MLTKRLKIAMWKLLYARWGAPPSCPEPGYSLLLLVPGDLPIFLRIAMTVCARQAHDHLVETLVIPDAVTPEFCREFEALEKIWNGGRLRVVQLHGIDRAITRMNNPFHNCWLQLVNGVNASTATHAIWHDADAFVLDPDFLKSQYLACVNENLACVGVNEVWDSWYRANDYRHLVATWELMFSNSWMRAFTPYEHRGYARDRRMPRHVYDITLLPQMLTSPEHIGRSEAAAPIIHFNHVICSYRNFQNARGGYEDVHFRLLLIRLLMEAFDPGGPDYGIPTLPELALGIRDGSQRVTYVNQATPATYPEFRAKLQELIDSPLLDEPARRRVLHGATDFDRAFDWSPASDTAERAVMVT
jgi:hypothetical protein